MTKELNVLGENKEYLKDAIYWRAINFQEALYKSYTYNRNNIHYQIFLLNDLQNLLRIALDSDKYDNDIDDLIQLFHNIETHYLDTDIEKTLDKKVQERYREVLKEMLGKWTI